jgi:predicted DsbA family dithiol-disulfide isomerase
MRNICLRVLLLAGLSVFGSGLVRAQDWATAESLPAVDLSGLTPAQKATVLKLLREHDCVCGCGMKAAQCRFQDPNCYYSRGLAAEVVTAVKQGKSAADAWTSAAASKFGHAPEHKLLEDPVPVATAGAPEIGPKDAPITLVEFSDFQCPYCYLAAPQLKQVLKAYPTQIKLIFKEFPLEMHSQAAFAATAAVAAQMQGKFWEMHDALFAIHTDLSRQAVLALASAVGLDVKRFESDLDSPAVRRAITQDMEDGNQAGVMSTPTLFIDGQRYNGPIKLDSLKPILEAELKHPVKEAKTASPSPAAR